MDPLGAALDGTDPLSQFAKLESDPLPEFTDKVIFILEIIYTLSNMLLIKKFVSAVGCFKQ